MVNEEIIRQVVEIVGVENVNKISSILGLPLQSTIVIITFFILVLFVWSLIWKGVALWKSSKNNHKFFFILILVLNTLGLLEILYIYWFSKINWDKKTNKKK